MIQTIGALMTRPGLGPDELLTTTRTVRRRLDLERPVSRELIEECLEVATQAPTGSNRQDWRFVVVTDSRLREQIAQHYRESFAAYRESDRHAGTVGTGAADRAEVQRRVISSADHLAAHLHEVPVHLIPCIERRAGDSRAAQAGLFGSILPATWSFMLAARARGLGTAFTTLHLRYEEEVASLLGIPYPDVTQAALIPVAHYTGEGFSPAPRRPVGEVTVWDGWEGRR